MKKLLLAGLLSAIGLVQASAASAEVIFTDADVGDSVSITFDGFSGDPSGTIPGLAARIDITLTGQADGGNDWLFSYNVVNQSVAPITASRVSYFAFNTTPDVVAASVTGVFDTVVLNANQPNQVPTVELCFTDQNCPGGGGGGVTLGTSAGGTFRLEFASNLPSITLGDVFIRWQSLAGAGLDEEGEPITSASGQETECRGDECSDLDVPEPGTLALLGLGAVVLALRRRTA